MREIDELCSQFTQMTAMISHPLLRFTNSLCNKEVFVKAQFYEK